MKRSIIKVERFRTRNHPKTAGDSIFLTLSCGHGKRYKASNAPKKMEYAFCNYCSNPNPSAVA